MVAYSKLLIDPFLSLNLFAPLLGVLIGAFITYKLTLEREHILNANDAFKSVYGIFYVKLSAIKTNIEIKKKEFGMIKYRKFNKQSKKTKNFTLITKQVLDVSEDIYKFVKKQDQDKLSIVVISRFFALEQIKEQIKLAEISILGIGEDTASREKRIARLYYELAISKISFVQGILEDMKKVSKTAKIKDKEMKKNIEFLLKTCKTAKRKGVSKTYGLEQPKTLGIFDVEKKPAG